MAVTTRVMMQRNTPAVARLRAIADLLDQLRSDLDQVSFLESEIADSRKFEEAEELAAHARTALAGVQDAVAEKGGASVAKGYK